MTLWAAVWWHAYARWGAGGRAAAGVIVSAAGAGLAAAAVAVAWRVIVAA